MKITRENCEAWFLDYYEGRLSKEGVEELFAFLIVHPDLRETFDSYEAVSFLPDEQIEFDRKADLRKIAEPSSGITLSNYEAYFVGAIEGTLNAEEQTQLEMFLAKHPSKRAELELLRNTILEPEHDVTFEAKDTLKKSVLITEENFEEYVVAALEGELSAEVLSQLEAFLAANEALKAEFELFAQTKLQPETEIVFENKNSLKKTPAFVSEENFGEMAIASVEGLLNTDEKKALDVFANANAERKNELAAYAQTKVQPDLSIVFEDKASLKRKEKDRGIIWWIADIRFAAAAAVALLIGIFWWNYSGNDAVVTPAGIAKVDSGKNQPKIVPADRSNEQQLANVNSSNSNTASQVNQTGTQVHPVNSTGTQTMTVVETREAFAAIPVSGKLNPLEGNYYQDVNFSGEGFESVEEGNPPATSSSISIGQYAMRWMKKKLDREPELKENNNEEDVHYAWNTPKNENQDVNGFDLTSSAVNRIGEATGSNLHLAKESEGTVLTIWKYRVLLNRNR